MQYCSLIANSKKKVVVKMVSGNDIVDVNKWWPQFYKKNTLSDESFSRSIPRNQKVSFTPSLFSEFVYTVEKPGSVIAQPYTGSFISHTFNLKQQKAQKISMQTIPKAYNQESIPINHNKMDHIKR